MDQIICVGNTGTDRRLWVALISSLVFHGSVFLLGARWIPSVGKIAIHEPVPLEVEVSSVPELKVSTPDPPMEAAVSEPVTPLVAAGLPIHPVAVSAEVQTKTITADPIAVIQEVPSASSVRQKPPEVETGSTTENSPQSQAVTVTPPVTVGVDEIAVPVSGKKNSDSNEMVSGADRLPSGKPSSSGENRLENGITRGTGNSSNGSGSVDRLRSALNRYLQQSNFADYYPQTALRRNIQGVVQVGLTFNAAGEIIRIKVSESSQYSLLDEAALRFVRDHQQLITEALRQTGWSGELSEYEVITPFQFHIF